MEIRQRIERIAKWLRRVVTQPRDELTRWQRTTRGMYDLGRHGYRQLRRDRAPQMAAALSYRTLFALVPVLVVAMVLLNSVRGAEAFSELAGEIFDDYGLNEIAVAGDAGAEDFVGLGQSLQVLIAQAAGINLAAIGWVGLIVVIYSAIGLMVTIENSFNVVYRAPEGRSWARRIPVYWFVLTVGPVAVSLTVFVSGSMAGWIETSGAWSWVVVLAPLAWSFLASWLLMVTVYALVPNTSVSLRSAMIGAFVAAVLLEAGKHGIVAYFAHAVSFERFYGSLGLIPVFMLWVYLMWLVVLFGLEVSAIVQSLGGRRIEDMEMKTEHRAIIDPACVLSVMQVIAERFAVSKPTTARQIAETALLPESTVVLLIQRLVEAGDLHRVEDEARSVTLARPPEQISADALIAVGYSLVAEAEPSAAGQMLKRLREAQMQIASAVTLANLGQSRAGQADGQTPPAPGP